MAQDVTKGIRRVIGSVKVEVAPINTSNWVSLGPGEGAGLTEDLKTDEYIPDNAATYGLVLLDQIDTIDFAAAEPDFSAFGIARGGIDIITQIPGTLVSGNVQTINSGVWSFNQFVPFTLQNATGAKPTLDTTHPCLAGSDGDLVENTDFVIVKNGGVWGIVVIDSTKVTTESQNLSVKYSATPASAIKMTTGGVSEIGFIRLRLTNTDPVKKHIVVEYYRAQLSKGFQLKFDSEKKTSKPNMWVFQFKGYRDESRDTGDQLRAITFEL
ncbi:MAG TPA: hypothetical protein VN429_11450 [Methanospirillum sp.]|uniref:hypothetical protein n=1 Tax=Methanospirillum sp. TaxID=45200 RepID=UPI002CBB2CFF|nr:hypothetical protein [Methanospirillum sp.]HWQ65024.1 hypothetical protein [Methanospirillum sp.]